MTYDLARLIGKLMGYEEVEIEVDEARVAHGKYGIYSLIILNYTKRLAKGNPCR